LVGDYFASAEDAEYIRGQHGGIGGFTIIETVNCKYGCQIFGPPGWMQEHYRDCPSRKHWEAVLQQQAEERLKRENAKLGLRPIIHDYGHFSAGPAGIAISEAEIKAEAAESYKKELLAASTQQVEEPEEESEESGGGEK